MIINDEEIICLKEFKYKDNDKILRVLSRDKGNIQLIAKGARKSKSKLLNVSQILCYSKCDLSNKGDMYILSNGELIKNFFNIRTNLDAFFMSSYILELIDYVSRQTECIPNLFEMTLKFFTVIDELSKYDESKNDLDILVSMFEIKLASMLGYRPVLSNCIYCGRTIKVKSHIDTENGGLICDSCLKKYRNRNLFLLDEKSIVLIEKLIMTKFQYYSELGKLDGVLINYIRQYLHFHIGKNNFKSLDMFKKI